MTPAPKPWPGDGDPRHETAVEASRRACWAWHALHLDATAEQIGAQAVAAYLRSLAEQGVVLVDAKKAEAATLKWVRERMDLLAFTTPRDQSWQTIYKQLRHEVAGATQDPSDVVLVDAGEVADWLDDQCGSARMNAFLRRFGGVTSDDPASR